MSELENRFGAVRVGVRDTTARLPTRRGSEGIVSGFSGPNDAGVSDEGDGAPEPIHVPADVLQRAIPELPDVVGVPVASSARLGAWWFRCVKPG